MKMISNERGPGDGGIPSLLQLGHAQPAAPDHERYA